MNGILKNIIQSMIFFVGAFALIFGILYVHDREAIGVILIIQGLAMILKFLYYQVK